MIANYPNNKTFLARDDGQVLIIETDSLEDALELAARRFGGAAKVRELEDEEARQYAGYPRVTVVPCPHGFLGS